MSGETNTIKPGITVLLIDDDAVSRAALAEVLRDQGFSILEAPDARSGIYLYQEQRPDVVMLEMLMPDKDGFETLFALRKICRDAKIIMMTGGGRITIDIYQQLAHSLQIPHLLLKPFAPADATKAVAAVLTPEGFKTGG